MPVDKKKHEHILYRNSTVALDRKQYSPVEKRDSGADSCIKFHHGRLWMKVHADMYNFLGPDIASEIPLETDRSGICIGHLRVIEHLKPHICGSIVSNFVVC